MAERSTGRSARAPRPPSPFGAGPGVGMMGLMAGLIMRKGPSPGVRFPLDERLVLGRHRNADVVVQDPGASRRHAVVVHRGGLFRVLDLGSTNGTLLNGRRVEKEALLTEGDLIQIGAEVFEFVVRDQASREPATVSLITAPLKGRTAVGPEEVAGSTL